MANSIPLILVLKVHVAANLSPFIILLEKEAAASAIQFREYMCGHGHYIRGRGGGQSHSIHNDISGGGGVIIEASASSI